MTSDVRHGTRFGYRDDKCKCDLCRAAIALEHNVYKLRRSANHGLPLTVSKRGAVRRIQALMVMGWPRRELARQAGYQGDALALILGGQRQRLELATHQRIVDLYERLSMTHGPSSSSRIRATKKGWAPPLAWDDIDNDPEPNWGGNDTDIDPVVVMRLLEGDRIPSTKAEKDAAMEQWVADGGSKAELCSWHGWKAGRYGRPALQVIEGGAA